MQGSGKEEIRNIKSIDFDRFYKPTLAGFDFIICRRFSEKYFPKMSAKKIRMASAGTSYLHLTPSLYNIP